MPTTMTTQILVSTMVAAPLYIPSHPKGRFLSIVSNGIEQQWSLHHGMVHRTSDNDEETAYRVAVEEAPSWIVRRDQLPSSSLIDGMNTDERAAALAECFLTDVLCHGSTTQQEFLDKLFASEYLPRLAVYVATEDAQEFALLDKLCYDFFDTHRLTAAHLEMAVRRNGSSDTTTTQPLLSIDQHLALVGACYEYNGSAHRPLLLLNGNKQELVAVAVNEQNEMEVRHRRASLVATVPSQEYEQMGQKVIDFIENEQPMEEGPLKVALVDMVNDCLNVIDTWKSEVSQANVQPRVAMMGKDALTLRLCLHYPSFLGLPTSLSSSICGNLLPELTIPGGDEGEEPSYEDILSHLMGVGVAGTLAHHTRYNLQSLTDIEQVRFTVVGERALVTMNDVLSHGTFVAVYTSDSSCYDDTYVVLINEGVNAGATAPIGVETARDALVEYSEGQGTEICPERQASAKKAAEALESMIKKYKPKPKKPKMERMPTRSATQAVSKSQASPKAEPKQASTRVATRQKSRAVPKPLPPPPTKSSKAESQPLAVSKSPSRPVKAGPPKPLKRRRNGVAEGGPKKKTEASGHAKLKQYLTNNPYAVVGHRVVKEFDSRNYFGWIVHYFPLDKWYGVIYDADDDQEDLTLDELVPWLKEYNRLKKRDKNKLELASQRAKYDCVRHENALAEEE